MLQDGLSALHLSLDSFKMMTSFYKSQKTSTQRPKIHSLTVPCSRASTASFPIQGQQCSDSFWDLSPSQAGRRTVISEEEQRQGFIWKKCCPMLPWWEGWAAGKAHREEQYQQLSNQTEEKNFNKQNASKVLIILQSHHKKTTIQTVTFTERHCDGHLIKFTLKIQDAPLLLCLPLTGRRDKISSQLPSNLCFPTAPIQVYQAILPILHSADLN